MDIAFSPQRAIGMICWPSAAGLLPRAEHLRQGGAVDVGIQQPDLQPLRRQRHREVHRGGRFADAALAGGDGDDLRSRPAAASRPARPAPGRARAAPCACGAAAPAPPGFGPCASRCAVSTAVALSTPGTLAHRVLRRRAQRFHLPRPLARDGERRTAPARPAPPGPAPCPPPPRPGRVAGSRTPRSAARTAASTSCSPIA